MDGASFCQAVEAAKETQLNRLDDQTLLLALTDATLDADRVLKMAAHSENAARTTFERWAATEADDGAREAFEAVAAQESEHLRRVLEALDATDFEPADGGPMHAYLRGRERTIERIAAGMVGRGLVSLRTHTQVIGFFVEEADERTADLFRDLRAETGDVVDDGLVRLDERCQTDEDWDRARAVAEYVIQVAYDDYADALREIGRDPNSIR